MSGRSLIRWLSIGALSAAIAVGAAIHWRQSLVRYAIVEIARSNGVVIRSLEVASIGRNGLFLRNIAIGDSDGPSARAIDIAWSWKTLRARRAGAVVVHEPLVSLTYMNGRFSIDGLTIERSDQAAAVPFDRLDIVAAKMSVTTPFGPGRIAGGAHVVSGPEGLAPARIELSAADLDFAGGKISVADIVFVPGDPLDIDFTVDHVNLEALLALIDVDGLKGSGAISGTVPVHIDADGVSVSHGRLAALGPGRLGYVGEALPQDIPGIDKESGGDVGLVRDALADFHYTALSFDLARSADGEGSLYARIEGANPKVLDNQPFILNIRLEANVDTLAEILLDGYATAGQLLQKASVR